MQPTLPRRSTREACPLAPVAAFAHPPQGAAPPHVRPLIGISTWPSSHHSAVLDIRRPLDALDRSYTDAVVAAGGMPVLLPVVSPTLAEQLVARLDGLVLSGGGDVDPALYGQEPRPEVEGVDPARDAFELALVACALDRELPLLAVCRGAQVLNVARGGTLVQHLPDEERRPNVDPANYTRGTHEVAVDAGTLLHGLVGDRVGVNSLHHQAVDQLGEGVVAVARDPAGVIEAVELDGGARVLGVQWHPELLGGDPDNDALFAWLVRCAGGPTAVTGGAATGG
jgi:putative glutamine amidotransferase